MARQYSLLALLALNLLSSSNAQSEVPDARPPPSQRLFNSSAVERVILEVGQLIQDDTLRQIFSNCLPSTLDTTVLWHRNATESGYGIPYTYIITGDIPAMWLRDSTYQVSPYVPLARNDSVLQQMIAGLINTQAEMILLHPYGNAFYALKHWNTGLPRPPSDWDATVYPDYDRTEVYQAKYELDSLASFLYWSSYYYENTDDLSFTQNPEWIKAVNLTLNTIKDQQKDTFEVLGKEPYNFTALVWSASETQNLYGKGNPVKRCGLVRSFFRPSDDSTVFQYLIPSNALTVVGLEGVANVLQAAGIESGLRNEISALAAEIREAINKYGIVTHPEFGQVYAFEVDCYGSTLFMDDAAFPNILSLAQFGYVSRDDPVYLNSRKYALSSQWNPYFVDGRFPGVGSLHMGLGRPWHMGQEIQAITSNNDQEILNLLWLLRNSTDGTGFMHESYDVNDPSQYTRPWFAWANVLFGELVLQVAQERPHLLSQRPSPK